MAWLHSTDPSSLNVGWLVPEQGCRAYQPCSIPRGCLVHTGLTLAVCLDRHNASAAGVSWKQSVDVRPGQLHDHGPKTHFINRQSFEPESTM